MFGPSCCAAGMFRCHSACKNWTHSRSGVKIWKPFDTSDHRPDPLTNQGRRFSRHEQSRSMPNASARALTIRSFCIAFDGRVIAKEPQHFPSRVRPSRIGVGTGGTATRPSVASSMDAPLL